jgi:ATP-dependent Lhr-like helicase
MTREPPRPDPPPPDSERRGAAAAPPARPAGAPRAAGTPASPVLPAPGAALSAFHPVVQAWFGASFPAPTAAQALGWPAIQRGESTLVLAPTGSGKTLAAFLAIVDRLMFEPPPAAARRCRAVYVSPLKALAVDVERNLRAPLAGIARAAAEAGVPVHLPEIAIRTGDTPTRERARFRRRPGDVLITTPESLYLVLTSQAREALRGVRWVIVDEIHAMVADKRGAHLALSLERLAELAAGPVQRIGLSATVTPPEEAARLLGGFAPAGAPRPVTIVDAGRRKPLEVRVEMPVEDLARAPAPADAPAPVDAPAPRAAAVPGGAAAAPARPAPATAEAGSSIWPAIHPLVLDLIRRHRSTLVFVNSRRLAERLAAALNDLAGETLVQAHHGSVARAQRLAIEEALKAGRLPALVATSSLELGIDMGAIDLVVHVEAPPAVSAGLQRIGRAGHQVGVPSTGVILPKHRGDLLACAALVQAMHEGAVEPRRYPRNPLDVLAQQVVAMVAMDEWPVDRLWAVLRRAAPFAELPRATFEGVLDMLAGRYPSEEFAELRPRLVWDRLRGVLRTREGARSVAIANAGTIPDRGLYPVYLADGPAGRARVGELDEEMVQETRVGETFLLGASTWRVEAITADRVLVSPAPGVPGKMPFWRGDAAGRPLAFGRAIGALTRTLRTLPATEAVERLVTGHGLSPAAAAALVAYLEEQARAAGAVPDDRTLVVERHRDELGDWRVCLLSPFGGRVHAPWAMALAARARAASGAEPDVLWTDDGIVARFPDVDTPPPVELLFPDPEEVEPLVVRQLGTGGAGARESSYGLASALFAARFREAAARALLLPRRRPGQRLPLWQQRRRASDLLHVASRFEAFPIVLEAYRECLRDRFDLPALRELLADVRSRAIRVVTTDTRTPSPFAASLMFAYVASFLYEGDAPLAERRAQALTVDPVQLRQLLGDVELRELIDADTLAELEGWLQHRVPERQARHPDALHDLLRQLGDLSLAELEARAAPPGAVARWLEQLLAEGRALRIRIAGEPRHVAAEDAGRYRDALGVSLPAGIPPAFLEPAADPLGELLGRYARTHGPFTAAEPARRLGVGIAAVQPALERLAAAGRLVDGELRPGGHGREWCDAGVLRTLRQRSLARLRREIAPVEPAVLGRFAVAWHGIAERRSGPAALLDALAQLQGAALPASVLETEILPARVGRYDPRDLDRLLAAGAVVWVGAGALGPKDGRIALYLAEDLPALLPPPEGPAPDGPLHARIREHLGTRGASFFPQLHQGLGGGFLPEVTTALWDLVWAGEVTNDTLGPLRALVHPSRVEPGGRRRARRARAWGAPGLPAGPRGFAPETAGRWSLVRSGAAGEPGPTERLAARVRQLLERHGIVTRETVGAEGLEGGFAAAYPVLAAMEEAGRVRRGYFVDGRGAAQFALPGAVDRLRSLRATPAAPETVRLAATDPANPYGAALPWPERSAGRKPMRVAGAAVILVDGALAGWLGPGERDLLTFGEPGTERAPEVVARALAEALAREPARTGRAIVLEEIDGLPVEAAPLAPALRAAGFAPTAHGYLRRPGARPGGSVPPDGAAGPDGS